jgi:hypothetical protein
MPTSVTERPIETKHTASSTNPKRFKGRYVTMFLKAVVFASILITFLLPIAIHNLTNKDNKASFVIWPITMPSLSMSVPKDPIISYKLIRGLQYNNTFDPFYICNKDRFKRDRITTHKAFDMKGNVDFHAQISTSLKILIIGDSVGIQFSQALQEATGAHPDHRHVVYHSWRKHEGVHIASPVRGGGAAAGFRITGLLKEKQKNNEYQLAPTPGGGWMTSNVTSLREALVRSRTIASIAMGEDAQGGEKQTRDNGDFDVVVFQFPFGWMEKPTEELFTHEALVDAVNTSHAQFGANTVILQTVPMQNNVIDIRRELININKAIYDFSNNYVPPSDGTGVQRIIVMDLAWLSFSLFAHNAVGLKILDDSTLKILSERNAKSAAELAEKLNPLLDARLNCCHTEYRQVPSFSCAEAVDDPKNTKYCKMNTYSLDGMHWCMVSMIFIIDVFVLRSTFDRPIFISILFGNFHFRTRPVEGFMEGWPVCYDANMSINFLVRISKTAKIDATIFTCH